MVWVVQPIFIIGKGAKKEELGGTILDPKGLFPFAEEDCSEGYSGEDISRVNYKRRFGEGGGNAKCFGRGGGGGRLTSEVFGVGAGWCEGWGWCNTGIFVVWE